VVAANAIGGGDHRHDHVLNILILILLLIILRRRLVNPQVTKVRNDSAGAVLRAPGTGSVSAFARRAIHYLLLRPAEVRWRAGRWAVSILAVAGAAMLVWSAVIHLMLWSDGYKDIPTIGPLFLAQGVVSIVIAVALAIFRRLALMAAGAVTLAATAVGLLLSVHIGLFGFQESMAVPYADSSLVVEFAGAGLLVIAAAGIMVGHWLGGPSRNSQP
jgi:hypothetical protein